MLTAALCNPLKQVNRRVSWIRMSQKNTGVDAVFCFRSSSLYLKLLQNTWTNVWQDELCCISIITLTTLPLFFFAIADQQSRCWTNRSRWQNPRLVVNTTPTGMAEMDWDEVCTCFFLLHLSSNKRQYPKIMCSNFYDNYISLHCFVTFIVRIFQKKIQNLKNRNKNRFT